MCRSNELGGRRCPLHSNPTYIANRNERRRAQYAKSKGSPVRAYVRQVKNTSSVSFSESTLSALDDSSHVFFSSQEHYVAHIPGATSPKLNYSVDSSTVVHHDNLNILSATAQGKLVEAGYFTDTVIDGKINHNNIDENSYSAFGFSAPEDSGSRTTIAHVSTSIGLSVAEMQNLSQKEKSAVGMYSGDNYDWINRALYQFDPDLLGVDKVLDKDSLFGTTVPGSNEIGVQRWNGEDVVLKENKKYLPTKDRTPAALQEITHSIDSALQKGTGKQRIVYRGVEGKSDKDGNVLVSEKEWVEQNLPLGQEIVFDGYQSTSSDFNRAMNSARKPGGVVYEILTPEGINITESSLFPEEHETLLPRGSRYTVVGIHKDVQTIETKPYPLKDEQTVSSVHTKDWGNLAGITIVQLVAINESGEVLNSTKRHQPPAVTEEQLGAHRVNLPSEK